MTILSYGYGEGSVAEQQWAQMSGFLGRGPTVAGTADWAVSAVAGQDRRVRVAAGTGSGRGILDISDTAVNLDLPTTTGTKYATIYAHRDWGADETDFRYSTYTTSPDVSGLLANDPGVLDDQPLAIVRVINGVQVPTVMTDLRTTIAEARAGWKAWQSLSLAGASLTYPGFGFQPQYSVSTDGRRAKLRGVISRTATLSNGALLATEENIATAHSVFVDVATEHTYIGNVGAKQLWTTSARLEINQAGQVSLASTNNPAWVDINCQFDRS